MMRSYRRVAEGADASPGRTVRIKRHIDVPRAGGQPTRRDDKDAAGTIDEAADRAAAKTGDKAAGGRGEHIFAMDIGTRSVIGLIGRMTGDTLRIDAVAAEEHQNRAVVDGQIEDIQETARIARRVKERLERDIGYTLSQVYIAAAGRVLRTGEAVHEEEIPEDREIDAAMVAKMEFAAIRRIHENLMKVETDHEDSFICVGHSVVCYFLDDYDFSSLIGHKGGRAAVKVIATFLPREVVESLNATMARIGLTVAGLTLEPIAAINAVIPQDIRKLNLALVDIGAGTADIAICEKGSVSAYTMVTVAGDEITEAIMEACLADFKTSEELKRKLGEPAAFTYENILGFEVETRGDELYQQVKPAVDHLVGVIGDKISGINKKPPAAVFLVGGGSRLPGLNAMVARELGMEDNRVVVGGSANMKKQASSGQEIFGPEFATPLGIAITAVQRERDESFTITVNRERVPMLGVWEMTVLDALQLAGYKYSQIVGKAGKSLIYDLDGERRSLRGRLPGASEITKNGQACALGDIVTPGDQLLFEPADPGKDAVLTVEEAAGKQDPVAVMVNGVNYTAGYIALINGRPAAPGQHIRSMDVIRHKTVFTAGDMCDDLGIDLDMYEIYINDRQEADEYILMDGDVVETRPYGEHALAAAAASAQAARATAAPPQQRREAAEAAAVAAGQTEATAVRQVDTAAGSAAGEAKPTSTTAQIPGAKPAPAALRLPGAEPAQAARPLVRPVEPRPAAEADAGGKPEAARPAEAKAVEARPATPAGADVEPTPLVRPAQTAKPAEAATTASAEAAAPAAEAQPVIPAEADGSFSVYLNGEAVRLQPKEDGMPHCFVDMFSYVKIDTKNPRGDLIQTVNGKEAPYMLELHSGDEVRIHWSEDTV